MFRPGVKKLIRGRQGRRHPEMIGKDKIDEKSGAYFNEELIKKMP